jgi:16S rRNA C967 or C1407 C5-methylase (RsmB/RsmF family)
MGFFSGALMKNSGVIVANDQNKERLKAVVGNVHRLGETGCLFQTFLCHEKSGSMNSVFRRKQHDDLQL